MRIVVASALGLLAMASAPATAGAAQRWASPASVQTSGACLAVDPCTLRAALNGAATGDEVLLAGGRYVMGGPLTASARVTLRGADSDRPVIVGSESSEDDAVLTLRTGGTLRHVQIEATRGEQDALELQGGLAEDVVLSSAGGNGAKVFGASSGTVLRDALVRSAVQHDNDRGALRIKDTGVQSVVTLRNVTALAPGANGIRCEFNAGTATIVNTLARGLRDIKAPPNHHCAVSHSSFRPAYSPNLAAGAGNQGSDPQLDADGRPLAGSPTVDAGASEPQLGATDLAGCPRTVGTAPDIGAYEFTTGDCAGASTEAPPLVPEPPVTTPTPTPTPTAPADATPPVSATPAPAPDTEAELPPGVPAPAQGTSMVVSPGQGKVLVRQPGTDRFVELEAGASIPVGSEIDASKGRVTLVTAVAGGLQDGTFWGGRFAVRQDRRGSGMTSLVLKGGSFKGCPKRVRASAAASKKEKPKRKLWSKDKNGRFRTHGHNSVATARGTNWLTEDTCAGTRTRVLEGAVAVRDTRTQRTKLVRAGGSYLARR